MMHSTWDRGPLPDRRVGLILQQFVLARTLKLQVTVVMSETITEGSFQGNICLERREMVRSCLYGYLSFVIVCKLNRAAAAGRQCSLGHTSLFTCLAVCLCVCVILCVCVCRANMSDVAMLVTSCRMRIVSREYTADDVVVLLSSSEFTVILFRLL